MAQLRDIRRRIQSVKNTQQVTSAMKMVAASKLRKAQKAVIQARPYANRLEEIISALLQSQELPEHPLFTGHTGDKLHLLVIAGEKGLCGSFNTNVFRDVETLSKKYPDLVLTLVGKKAVDHFKNRNYTIQDQIIGADKMETEVLAGKLAQTLSDAYISGECHKVAITYTEFQTALTQNVVTEWLLPLTFETQDDQPVNLDYIFYPDPQKILNLLLPRYILSQINRSLLESHTSEQGSRMTAMDMATRNSEDMIGELTLLYNRARQAAITTELIEIVSGSEAL